MEKAKQAVSKFVSRDGKHDTTVDESIQKAVTDEHVRPHQHEDTTTAIDKEVHQDHHHTVVQPIEAKETLPEKHTHNMLPVQHETIDHRNDQGLRDQLSAEAAQFKDSSVTHEATQSASIAPTMSGEHVHHHVHEHVQPVIQKETVMPEYVHTTVPIHETHHAEAKHHGTSVLPPISMSEFEGKEYLFGGQEEKRVQAFEGCPKTYEKKLQAERTEADENMHAQVV